MNPKFNIRQSVYIGNSDSYKECIIRKRKLVDKEYIYQLSLRIYIFYPKPKKPIWDKDIYPLGYHNYPRMDNWIQENRILKEIPRLESSYCSKNGCELVDEFLGDPIKEDKQVLNELTRLLEVKEYRHSIPFNEYQNHLDSIREWVPIYVFINKSNVEKEVVKYLITLNQEEIGRMNYMIQNNKWDILQSKDIIKRLKKHK